MYLTIVNEVDFQKLQSALNSLYSWATAWQLPISIDKCYVLNIGAENFCCKLEINNQALPVDGVDTDIATVSVNIVRLVSALVPTFFIERLRTV